jgi:cyd operon protein YbgT
LHGAEFFFMIAAKGGSVGYRVRGPRCGFTLGSDAHLRPQASRYRSNDNAQRFRSGLVRHTIKETAMWYFTWILGIGVALGFGIINVMWLEAGDKFTRDPQRAGAVPATPEDAPS